MVSPELLRRYTFFAGLDDKELTGIAMIAEEVSFPPGTTIFHEGAEAVKVYVLTAGAVELGYRNPHSAGPEMLYVGSIAPGEPFGLSAFVGTHPLTATARAKGPSRAIAIDAWALRALSELDCHLGYVIMRQIASALAERLNFLRVQLAAAD
jgi:CRP/FNR family transcriptional regulator, cyclic AMP receptor protein